MNMNYFILLTFLITEIYTIEPIHLTIVVCGQRYRINEIFVFYLLYLCLVDLKKHLIH